MRSSHLAALALGAGLLFLPAARAEEPKVELKDVTYAGLADAVKAQRGKVVVVEVWANY